PMPQSFARIFGVWIAFSDDKRSWGGHLPLALPRWGMWDELRTGASAVPFKTERGWLELYHGVDRETTYAMGAVLLDLADPRRGIRRGRDRRRRGRVRRRRGSRAGPLVRSLGAHPRAGRAYLDRRAARVLPLGPAGRRPVPELRLRLEWRAQRGGRDLARRRRVLLARSRGARQ